MALVFNQARPSKEPEEAVDASPAWGKNEVAKIKELVALTNAYSFTTLGSRDAMLESINEKYRTKRYRDYIRSQFKAGHIDEDQIDEIANTLRAIRYCRRTPTAKSYRRDWM